ncbi:CAP domain-containing protein [Sphingomonas sp. LY160]|uniref:CAP domain-containing protein n=1 Tax=Sphingomonas sp. LY160 TaxID=3095342 RepID=UPI002ADEB5D1|nr:CAP domain-containing protein [Sphingomonas sp. LY160]MEA1071543.1 CAP domain-containing protein [Sphingomonas sp. LY160]
MIAKLLTAMAVILPAASVAAPPHRIDMPWVDRRPQPRGAALLKATMMKAHNDARSAVGAAALVWDPALAADATVYAAEMARTRVFRHDPRPERRRLQGENIWMGTRTGFSYATMIGQMINERRDFRAGAFPNVSRTGKWSDVGHYTQVIWPTTTRVGCGTAANATDDFLVCRYSPRGNMPGIQLP